MKKHFTSLWFRVVIGFFWCMTITFGLISVSIYLLIHLWKWNFFPRAWWSFLIMLGLISIGFGTIISIFAGRYVLNPIIDLSKAMQKVAKGDYTIKMNPSCYQGEVKTLYEDFNQMVQELNSIETLHSDFISNVSHEFKTPLATISGYATLLQDDSLSLEERNEYIDIIIKSAKDLSKMTGNILNLSRLENQTIVAEKEFYRVDEQIRQIILRIEPIWSEKNLVINPDLDAITWYGNRELTAHIWNNLLDNAVKFTPVGGEINITARADEKWLTVTFEDSGIGMDSEVQKHIFDKFYQGDTSHKKNGNGLGLALVKQIVSLYGGSIQLTSYPELGSSFQVILPLES